MTFFKSSESLGEISNLGAKPVQRSVRFLGEALDERATTGRGLQDPLPLKLADGRMDGLLGDAVLLHKRTQRGKPLAGREVSPTNTTSEVVRHLDVERAGVISCDRHAISLPICTTRHRVVSLDRPITTWHYVVPRGIFDPSPHVKEFIVNAPVSTTARNRSQVWFRPGRHVPVRRMPVSNVLGIEVLAESRGGVQVGRTTIHGTAGELRELAAQILRAVGVVEAAERTAQESGFDPGGRPRAA